VCCVCVCGKKRGKGKLAFLNRLNFQSDIRVFVCCDLRLKIFAKQISPLKDTKQFVACLLACLPACLLADDDEGNASYKNERREEGEGKCLQGIFFR